ncbi:MAG: M28 family peptidase [Acidobacteriota bacterium]|jgi:hypothetical protein|nr:M28 family peptidase [Acidobacteriota bacterium]
MASDSGTNSNGKGKGANPWSKACASASTLWRALWLLGLLCMAAAVPHLRPPLPSADLFADTRAGIDSGAIPLRFDADGALGMAREFVTQFPTRVFGTLEARQATGFLTDRLAAMGYEVEYSHYDGRIGKSPQAGRNVLALKRGEGDGLLVVTAHFDTARPTVQGASKNGAAVGVLLQLAETFAREKTRHTLLFAFTDGGEWGSTGARELCLNYGGRDKIVAALSLDHVAPGKLAGLRLDATGQLGGATPGWLLAAAVQAGVPAPDAGWGEFLRQTFRISQSDQGPFLRAGVPALNLGSVSTDEKRAAAVVHSPADVIDGIEAASVGLYGSTAEKIVRLLDGVRQPPRENLAARLARGVLPGALLLITLSFAALAWLAPPSATLAASDAGGKARGGIRANRSQVMRELFALSLTCIPLLLVYFGIRLAYAARQFPLYDLYPAVAQDPAMLNPQLKPLAAIAGAVLFFAVAAWVIGRYFLKEWGARDAASSRFALLLALAAVVVGGIAYDASWAFVFLLPAGLLWTLADIWFDGGREGGAGGKRGARAFHAAVGAALVCAPALTAALALGWLARELGVGWRFYWYQALALATGLFSPAAFLLSAVTVAVGIRLLALHLRR